MGGSDQWGNIVNGIDLGRRLLNAELFALTTPLLTTASGQKMGKTESGAVWLNADMMRPYDYWQFWRNCEDADTVKLLKLFTDLPLDEIGRRAAAAAAAATARQTFEEGTLAASLPTVEVPRAELDKGIGVLTAFAEKTGLVASNGEARRQIKAGGLRVNDQVVTDDKMMLTPRELTPEGVIKLSLGRKRHILLKPV
jgi:tyrosyl-tRNA synthetase